jgi:hypothetical protein
MKPRCYRDLWGLLSGSGWRGGAEAQGRWDRGERWSSILPEVNGASGGLRPFATAGGVPRAVPARKGPAAREDDAAEVARELIVSRRKRGRGHLFLGVGRRRRAEEAKLRNRLKGKPSGVCRAVCHALIGSEHGNVAEQIRSLTPLYLNGVYIEWDMYTVRAEM